MASGEVDVWVDPDGRLCLFSWPNCFFGLRKSNPSRALDSRSNRPVSVLREGLLAGRRHGTHNREVNLALDSRARLESPNRLMEEVEQRNIESHGNRFITGEPLRFNPGTPSSVTNGRSDTRRRW